MKKLICFVAAIVICGAAIAQENPEDWQTRISLGFNLNDGNSDTMLGTLSVASEKTAGPHIIALGAEAAYGESEMIDADGVISSEPNAQNAKARASYKRKFDRAFAHLDTSLAHDDIAAVDYRFVAGIGLGYYIVDNGSFKLSISVGPGYLLEDVGDVSDDYPTLQIAQGIEWVVSETATVKQSVGVQSKVDDLGNYLLTAEASLETTVSESMNLRLSVKDTYDSDPAESLKKNDIAVMTALSVKL